MNQLDRHNMKSHAAEALCAASYNPRKLALIHTAVSTGVAFLIAVLNYLLTQQIAGTGGLSGIANRSLLETAKSLLQIANLALLPFWEVGLLFACLSISRRKAAGPGDLLAGFHRFGPIFRGKLLQGAMLASSIFIGMYLGTILFSITPVSQPFYDAAEPYLSEGVLDYALLMEDEAVMSAMLYAVPFMMAGMAVLTVPIFYRLRMMEYILLDHPEKGAFFAMRASKMIMRGKRMDLFKLDLSFWWFYALEVLIALVCYGDMILPMMHIDLGMSADVAFFVFYAVALLCQLGLYTWKKPQLLTTYAGFYESVLPKEEESKEV